MTPPVPARQSMIYTEEPLYVYPAAPIGVAPGRYASIVGLGLVVEEISPAGPVLLESFSLPDWPRGVTSGPYPSTNGMGDIAYMYSSFDVVSWLHYEGGAASIVHISPPATSLFYNPVIAQDSSAVLIWDFVADTLYAYDFAGDLLWSHTLNGDLAGGNPGVTLCGAFTADRYLVINGSAGNGAQVLELRDETGTVLDTVDFPMVDEEWTNQYWLGCGAGLVHTLKYIDIFATSEDPTVMRVTMVTRSGDSIFVQSPVTFEHGWEIGSGDDYSFGYRAASWDGQVTLMLQAQGHDIGAKVFWVNPATGEVTASTQTIQLHYSNGYMAAPGWENTVTVDYGTGSSDDYFGRTFWGGTVPLSAKVLRMRQRNDALATGIEASARMQTRNDKSGAAVTSSRIFGSGHNAYDPVAYNPGT